MVTKQQIADRKRTVASAIASQHLEGIAPDQETLADLERFAQGKLAIFDILACLHRRMKNKSVPFFPFLQWRDNFKNSLLHAIY